MSRGALPCPFVPSAVEGHWLRAVSTSLDTNGHGHDNG